MPIYTASAKVNLSLNITGKNDKEYHLLDSLVTHTVYGDFIEVIPHDKDYFTMEIVGAFTNGLDRENNSVINGASFIHSFYPHMSTCHIILTKNLPIASGIGGGSSNCATIIKALLELWSMPAPVNLATHLLEMGADMPVCFLRTSSIMRGIGEKLTPHTIPQMHIVLANPKVGVSTPEIFKNRTGTFTVAPYYPAFKTVHDVVTFLQSTGNDLTRPAVKSYPVIDEVLHTLSNASLYHGMSGSGATCFAICADEDTAKKIVQECSEKGYWSVATTTI